MRSELRLIGGKYRSRKIIFSHHDSLRPTHDRIRETIFNWLAPAIENSICLDAFAGSGALGFEALSRGAQHVTFLDISKEAITDIQFNLNALNIKNADYQQCDFMLENTALNKKYDIIFLDPPFSNNQLILALHLLITKKLLNPHALIYFECAKNSVDFEKLNCAMEIKKRKNTKRVEYGLLEWSGSSNVL